MPKLIIDDQEIEVPTGTKVIDAAEKLGIVIPRFCFHPALGSVGACRVCAVKFLEGPFKGVQMSCMIDAKDGMVVSTTDEEAVDFRRYVIEWLMLNHPHDCPVCDEGGHCLLQDMTIAGGHGIRRFHGKKRTHQDQYLGPLIQHEMNRCIQCYRCSRFYQEFTGYRDLGVMQIASRVYFGRYKAGTLESPFAGNLTDICPTGVYTDKPSRFIGRRWDYKRSPSVCINCSLGCHTVVSSRYREVVRQEAKFSEAVNGYFICDRGRYGFFYAGQDERPRHARIDGKEVSREKAFQAASERLDRISLESGTGAVAWMGSTRSSLETQAALKRLCQTKGWQGPVYSMDHDIEMNVKTAVSKLESGLTASLSELEKADFILAVGVDPVNEAPMLAMAMRQAQQCGAKVVLVDPRPITLPFNFYHLPIASREIEHHLAFIVKDTVDPDTAEAFDLNTKDIFNDVTTEGRTTSWNRDLMDVVKKNLKESQRPVIVCGTEIVSESITGLAGDLAWLLKTTKNWAGLFYLLPGANAFGAALLSDLETSFEHILSGIENGSIKALVLVENNPYWYFANRVRLERALERLDVLVVMDYLDSRIVRAADILLPTLTVYEAGGLFVNQEGRVQKLSIAYRGGRPVSQISGGSHPPRSFRHNIPGGEAEPAWQVLSELTAKTPEPQQKEIYPDLMKWLAETHPLFSNLFPVDVFPDTGIRISPGQNIGIRTARDRFAAAQPALKSSDKLELITVDWTFGTEELSACSPYLKQIEKDPCLFMQSDDAAQLGISNGDTIAIRSVPGIVNVQVGVVENMARGVLVMPRHRKLDWQHLDALRITVSKNQIYKVEEDE